MPAGSSRIDVALQVDETATSILVRGTPGRRAAGRLTSHASSGSVLPEELAVNLTDTAAGAAEEYAESPRPVAVAELGEIFLAFVTLGPRSLLALTPD